MTTPEAVVPLPRNRVVGPDSVPEASQDIAVADVQAVLDQTRIGGFAILVLCVIFFLALADGCDLQVSSFAASDLARDWGMPKSALAPFLSAGLFGLLFGAPAFGWVGDRYGRKPAVILSCGVISVASLLCAAAQDLPVLIAARAAAGFGIGGLMPNLIALTSEIAPSRRRGVYVVLISTGVGFGAALTASLPSVFPTLEHWRNLFLLAAAAPLVGGVLAAVMLPESPAMLALGDRDDARLVALLRRLRPAAGVTHASVAKGAEGETPVQALFAGSLRVVTPALWLLAATMFMTAFLVTSWTPVLLKGSGLSEAESGHAISLLHVGGTVGSLVASLFIDRFGWKVIGTYAAIAAAGAAAVGVLPAGPAALAWLLAIVGFGLVGAQSSLNAAAGLVYRSIVRSRGAGLVFATARIGSIIGTMLGGTLLAIGLAGRHFYLATLAPLSAAVLITLIILRFGARQGRFS